MRNVGLNADWSCTAYHFGPSATPNRTDGDVYVLDNEDDDRTYSVVRRWYRDDDNDRIEQVGPDYATLDEAAHAASTLADSLTN